MTLPPSSFSVFPHPAHVTNKMCLNILLEYLDLCFQDDKCPFLWTATVRLILWFLAWLQADRPSARETISSPQMEFSFSRGMAAWHNALCLGNYFFSACVAFSSSHGWLALGRDRWRPPVSLTRVERVWWFSDERQAGQWGTALCLRDVLMRSGKIRGLRPYLKSDVSRLTVEAALICRLGVIQVELRTGMSSVLFDNKHQI